VIRGIDEELAKSNYNLILYTTHRHHGKESIYVATIRNGGVDGLLLVAPLITTPYLDALRQQDFPYVLVDQLDSAQKSFSVSATNRQGACQATRYLIELGHRRIGFIAGLSGLYSAVERQEGYAAALADHGIPLCNDLIVQGEFSFEEGYSAVEKLLALEERPTAIFASNDLSAFGALEAIRQHGLRIPDDISLLGFDDIPQASVTYPKLTTVRQPLEQMGRAAVAMLLDCIANPDQRSRQITLTTQLVIRDSCAPPPSQ
jgi:LacI family transcriptional regulator